METTRETFDTALPYHIDAMYAYAMVLTRNPDVAADLVQETCLRALQARESLQPNPNLKAWLLTILRNIWFNEIRRKRCSPVTGELDSDESVEGSAIDPSKSQLEICVSKTELERIRKAIAQLPVEHREIILLREYRELSYREIASILKCPVGTVMSRLARARSSLRALL